MLVATYLNQTDTWFQNYKFNVFLESHLSYILQNYMAGSKDIPPNVAARYQGDYYGLLSSLGVKIDYHYIVLRLNGFYNSVDYDGSPITVNLPDLAQIDLLRNVFRTTQTASS